MRSTVKLPLISLLPTSWKRQSPYWKSSLAGSAISAVSATSMNCRRTAESMWNSLRSRSDSLSPWSATAREGKISSIVRVLWRNKCCQMRRDRIIFDGKNMCKMWMRMERAWCWYEISPCPFWYTMNPAGILITQYLAECKHSQNAVLHGSE